MVKEHSVSKLQGVMDNYRVNCYHSFPNCKRSKRLSDIYSLVKEVIMDASKVTDRSWTCLHSVPAVLISVLAHQSCEYTPKRYTILQHKILHMNTKNYIIVWPRNFGCLCNTKMQHSTQHFDRILWDWSPFAIGVEWHQSSFS